VRASNQHKAAAAVMPCEVCLVIADAIVYLVNNQARALLITHFLRLPITRSNNGED
jgi:hypothetical protein